MPAANLMISAKGTTEVISGTVSFPTEPCPATAGGKAGPNPFGRLVALYQSNEFLSGELSNVNRGLNRARAYLEAPGGNPVLAEARLRQLQAKHSAVLTLLRANRVEARAFLARAALRDETSAA